MGIIDRESAFDSVSGKREFLPEDLLQQRLRYERGISGFLKELLIPENNIENALKRLLFATGASRVYIYENRRDRDGSLKGILIAEVCADGIKPVMGIEEFKVVDYRRVSKFAYERFSNGQVVNSLVKKMPKEDRKILMAQDILSILNIPIFVDSKWYGLIGFDDCVREYLWTKDDVNMLKTAAEMYGLFIENQIKIKRILESEKRYKVLLENIPDPIIIVDYESEKIVYCNDVFWKITGFKPEDVIGKSFEEVGFRECGLSIGSEKSESIEHKNLEYSLKISDGTYRHYILSKNSIHFDGKKHILIVAKDITANKEIEAKRRKLEKELQDVERIKAIGTLAGGIAHDFNNLLMAIGGNISLMLMDKNPADPDYEKLKKIEEYIKNGSNFTKQLLGYARGGKYETRVADINELIRKTGDLFGRTKKEIAMEFNLSSDLLPVEIDINQMEQVLLNIYINAWQAMPDGGRIVVETKNVELASDSLGDFRVKPGKYVGIFVSDTGIGMDRETQRRIFEPFFSTKKREEGNGMGMASAYGIVKNHNGYIDVESEIGVGTTFSIYLPAAVGRRIEVSAFGRENSIEIYRGTGTILVVDDEEVILTITEKLLNILGYSVLRAGSAREAITIYEEYMEKIDLVILDMTMPEVGGRETFFRLKSINPDVKVLISSGYGKDSYISDLLNEGCKGFIQKPFDLESLSSSVREILEESD